MESGGPKLGIEVHGMAYAFSDSTQESLYNTVFLNYRVINRSPNDYHNAYWGFASSWQIGGGSNDYFATDPRRGLMIGYSGYDFDWPGQGSLGYGDSPPALGVTVFSGATVPDDGLDNPVGWDDGESPNGIGFGDAVNLHQRVDQRGHVAQVNHVGTVAGRVVRILMRFHEYSRSANGDGGSCHHRCEFSLTARRSAASAG